MFKVVQMNCILFITISIFYINNHSFVPKKNKLQQCFVIEVTNERLFACPQVYKSHSKMIQLSNILPCPEELRPLPLFKPGLRDASKLDRGCESAVPNESAIIRSCFDCEWLSFTRSIGPE